MNNKEIEQIIRVNHAGEYGAKRIYQGQMKIFKNTEYHQIISKMQEQEEEHLKYFKNQIIEKRIRPSILNPLWNIGGYALGLFTAFCGIRSAMICTEAIEEVIGEHYNSQVDRIHDNDLKDKIIEFRNDELDHKNTATSYDLIDSPLYAVLSNVIKIGCKASIWLAKKF